MSDAIDRTAALACAAQYGIDQETASAVIAAYETLGQRVGKPFDPAHWTRTVWLAEADRWQRSENAEAHYTLILQLEELRQGFEKKVDRGARAWIFGELGERLTKR